MIDWSLPPDLQKRYDEILATTRRLQAELGIEPRTLEQRYQDYLKRKEDERRQAEEQERLLKEIGKLSVRKPVLPLRRPR